MKTAVEDQSENRRQPARRVSVGHLSPSVGPSSGGAPRVADVMIPTNAMSLPAWFSSAKACAVLRLKGQSFALFTDARGGSRVASLARLAVAPAEQALVCSSEPLGPRVNPATPLAEALRLMDAHGADHVTVERGGVMLGLLARSDAQRVPAVETWSGQATAAPSVAAPARFAA